MEFLNSDFINEMQLAGVFMCRRIKNIADNSLDLLIYRQNPGITENGDLLGLVQGKRLSSLKNAGIILSTDFWQNIERRGVATSAFTAVGFHFQLHVFEADDNYLLNVYRKAVEPFDKKSQSLPIEADRDELKNTQKQLWLANERLKLASKAGKIGVWDFNSSTNTFSWDEETYMIHGVPLGSTVTMNDLLKLVHPEDRSCLLNKIAQQETDLDVIRIIRPDGNTRFVKSSSMLLTARDGMPFDMIGVVTDVTESTLSGLTLSESEKRYRFLVNNLKEVIFQTDLQLNLLFLSPAWLKWTGVEAEAALQNNPLNYIHPEDVILCRQKLDELVQRTIDHSLLEIRYLNKSEGYKWIEVFSKLTLLLVFTFFCVKKNSIRGIFMGIQRKKQFELWIEKYIPI